MWALGVVDQVEPVHLGLELLVGRGQGLLVQPAEEGLMEPFILPLRGRLIRLAGDRLDPERGHVDDQLADPSTADRIQGDSSIKQQS